jgi:hypothetical protein
MPKFKEWWSYTSTPSYIFMAWCLIKTTSLYIESVSISIYIAAPFFSVKIEAAGSSQVSIPISD